MLARIVNFIKKQGSVAGTQLAHAGRKASTAAPWLGGGPVDIKEGGWRPIYAPSAIPFDEKAIVPEALDTAGIQRVVKAFADAAVRALHAGFKVIELHAAHGYLIHEFLSPLTNLRDDEYGGSSRIAHGLRARWSKPSGAYGLRSIRCSCAYRPRTGKKGDGRWRSPSNYRNV